MAGRQDHAPERGPKIGWVAVRDFDGGGGLTRAANDARSDHPQPGCARRPLGDAGRPLETQRGRLRPRGGGAEREHRDEREEDRGLPCHGDAAP